MSDQDERPRYVFGTKYGTFTVTPGTAEYPHGTVETDTFIDPARGRGYNTAVNGVQTLLLNLANTAVICPDSDHHSVARAIERTLFDLRQDYDLEDLPAREPA